MKSNSSLSKKQEQGLATRKHILHAAELVFFEKGATATTLELIAEKAQVTRGAIYWHFKNKSQLLEEVIDEAIIPLLDSFRAELVDAPEPSFNQLRKASVQIMQTLLGSPAHLRRLTIALLKCEYTFEFEHIIERHTHYHDEVRGMLTSYLTKLEERDGNFSKSPQMIADALSFYLTGMLMQFLKHPDKIDLATDITAYIDIFFDPLAYEQSKKTQGISA